MAGGEHTQKQDSKFNMHLNCMAYQNIVSDLSFAKLQGILGEEIFIKVLPCLIGKNSSRVKN